MNQHDTVNLIDLDDPPQIQTQTQTRPLPSHMEYPTTHRSISQPLPRNSQTSSSPSPSPPLPPLPRLQHASTTSSSGYGIGSAVWGLLRRISSVDPSTTPPTPPPATSQLYHRNAAHGDGINGAFTPPRRTATPRGLPSLEPLNLRGYREDTELDERLLARGIAEEIRTFLPERLKIMEDWRLVYSLYQNGSSLATMYQLCERYRGVRAGFVLVVRDGKDGIFGAYLTEAPHPAASYYGTGECFLWRASLHAPLPPPPSADTTDMNYRTTTIASTENPDDDNNNNNNNKPVPPGSTQSIRFQAFAYSGANDYCMWCETKFLSVGGGQGGKFGLWLNDSLSRGHSAECDTFLNEALSDEGEKFDIMGVELWVVGAV